MGVKPLRAMREMVRVHNGWKLKCSKYFLGSVYQWQLPPRSNTASHDRSGLPCSLKLLVKSDWVVVQGSATGKAEYMWASEKRLTGDVRDVGKANQVSREEFRRDKVRYICYDELEALCNELEH